MTETVLGPLPAGIAVVLPGAPAASSSGSGASYLWGADQRRWQPWPGPAPVAMAPEAVATIRDADVSHDGGVAKGRTWRLELESLGGSPYVVHHRYARTPDWPARTLRSAGRVGEAVLLAQPGDEVFGHHLIDLLPRVLTARRAGLGRLPMLIRKGSAQPFAGVLDALGVAGVTLRELPHHGVVRVGQLYVMTGARQSQMLDGARLREIAALMRAGNGDGRPTATWMSRADFARPRHERRRLLNRIAVDQGAAIAGLVVLSPERMPLNAVRRHLAPGGLLGGEDGSALHNCLAMPAGSAVLMMGHPDLPGPLHRPLAAALSQTIFFVRGREVPIPGEATWHPRARTWEIAPDVIADLPEIFGSLIERHAPTS